MRKLFLAVLVVLPTLAAADAYDDLGAACRVNVVGPLAERYCSCLVDEVKKRVSEPELGAFFRPEPAPSDVKVDAAGHASARVCREKLEAESTRI